MAVISVEALEEIPDSNVRFCLWENGLDVFQSVQALPICNATCRLQAFPGLLLT